MNTNAHGHTEDGMSETMTDAMRTQRMVIQTADSALRLHGLETYSDVLRQRDELLTALQVICAGVESEHYREWSQGIARAALSKSVAA